MRFTGALFAAACALAAIATPALAADLGTAPLVKAQQQPFITGTGYYVGISSEAAVANGAVSGLGLPPLTGGGVTATGGKIGFDVGYIKSACIMGTWCQAEFDAKWQNINGSNASGSIQSNWSVSGEFDVGAGAFTDALAQLGGNLPFPTFGGGTDPTKLLPGWVKTTGAPRPYFGGIVEGYGISGTSIGTKSGQTIAFAAGLTTGWRWQLLNAAGQPSDSSVKLFFKYEWLNQGFDVTGILASPGGAPPAIVRGSGQINTLAAAGLNFDFGL